MRQLLICYTPKNQVTLNESNRNYNHTNTMKTKLTIATNILNRKCTVDQGVRPVRRTFTDSIILNEDSKTAVYRADPRRFVDNLFVVGFCQSLGPLLVLQQFKDTAYKPMVYKNGKPAFELYSWPEYTIADSYIRGLNLIANFKENDRAGFGLLVMEKPSLLYIDKAVVTNVHLYLQSIIFGPENRCVGTVSINQTIYNYTGVVSFNEKNTKAQAKSASSFKLPIEKDVASWFDLDINIKLGRKESFIKQDTENKITL